MSNRRPKDRKAELREQYDLLSDAQLASEVKRIVAEHHEVSIHLSAACAVQNKRRKAAQKRAAS
jgi:hypothetical protein